MIYTHFALDIKDENIIFTDCQEEIRGGKPTKIYYGTLKATMERCPACGSQKLVHNGNAPLSIAYLTADASRPVYIDLRFVVGNVTPPLWRRRRSLSVIIISVMPLNTKSRLN